MKHVICGVVVAVLALAGGWAAAQEPADTFIIEGIPDGLEEAVAAAGGTLLRVHPEIGYAVAVSTNPDFTASLGGTDGVLGVEQDLMAQWVPDFQGGVISASSEGSPGSDPSGAFFRPCQWNMDQVDASSAWSAGVFGDGITVAVLDTGIDPYHQDLWTKVDTANSASFLSPGVSFCNPYGIPDEQTYWDFDFHGTFVASQITGNGIDMASVAPGAEVVGVKVLDCTGWGTFSDIIAGILYAAGLPNVDIINMSLSAYFPKNAIGGGQLLGATNAAVNYATSQGKLVVAAAGNDGANLDKDKNWIHWPSQAGTAVSIYATDIVDGLASYSNYGRSGTWVGAPGGEFPYADTPLPGCGINPTFHGSILGACSSFSVWFTCGSGVVYLAGGTGTSFSAPIAAGVAALIDGNYGGMLNGGQLKTGLKKTADDLGKKGTDAIFSHGRVNAGEAAQY